MSNIYNVYANSRPHENKSAVVRFYEDMDRDVIEQYKREHKEFFKQVTDEDLQAFIDEASAGIIKRIEEMLDNK